MKRIENMIASAKLHLGAIKFDRNELSGAFGDIGTDFPLIVGMILASGLDNVSLDWQSEGFAKRRIKKNLISSEFIGKMFWIIALKSVYIR